MTTLWAGPLTTRSTESFNYLKKTHLSKKTFFLPQEMSPFPHLEIQALEVETQSGRMTERIIHRNSSLGSFSQAFNCPLATPALSIY